MVKLRAAKVRSLAVLPAVAVACLAMTACETKVGTAAVIGDSRISETQVNDYLTANAQPIQGSQGQSTPARLFVLRTLVRNAVVPRLLTVTGGSPSASDLAKARQQLLAGTTESDLSRQLTQVGLVPKFADPYLQGQEMLTFLQSRITTQAQLDAAVKQANLHVSVSPRYGAWNPAALSVSDLGAKQLPDAVTFDRALPGDAQATQSR
jgi:hypothetical protein